MILGKKHGSKKGHFIFFIIFLVALGGLKLWQYRWPKAEVTLDGAHLNVLVAKTPWHWHRGLGKRANMDGFDAMLFIYPKSDRYGFVMRDMQFPIDIVWIHRGIVVDIAPAVPIEPGKEEGEYTVYLPRTEADTVIELPAGWAAANDLKIGDILRATD